MSFLFKNFDAASRKPNMAAFGMFPGDRNLDWIANNLSSPTPVTVAYSSTPSFELADGSIQRITLSGDVTSSTFVLNGGTSIPDGYQFYLRVLQDATGGRLFEFPANVRNPANFLVGQDANIMTSFFFEYRNSGWDFSQVPVEGPVVQMFPGMSSLPPRASAPVEEIEIEEEETPMHEEMEAASVDISPEAVCYRDETQKCGNCAYMEPSGECMALKMNVEAEASCNLFKGMEG